MVRCAQFIEPLSKIKHVMISSKIAPRRLKIAPRGPKMAPRGATG